LKVYSGIAKANYAWFISGRWCNRSSDTTEALRIFSLRIKEKALTWIKQYITYRTQRVSVADKRSSSSFLPRWSRWIGKLFWEKYPYLGNSELYIEMYI